MAWSEIKLRHKWRTSLAEAEFTCNTVGAEQAGLAQETGSVVRETRAMEGWVLKSLDFRLPMLWEEKELPLSLFHMQDGRAGKWRPEHCSSTY